MVYKGKVWSFTVANHLNIDDFDPYSDTATLQANWASTGSASLEGSIALHNNSLKMEYNNSQSPYVKTATRTFTAVQDWTDYAALQLFVRGDSTNYTGHSPVFVTLTDSDSSATVQCLADADVTTFAQCDIPLSDFTGITLSDIKSIAVKVGDGTASGQPTGDMDVIYVDDISLWPPRCFPEKLQPAGDLNSDCVVDFADVAVITENWLLAPSIPTIGMVGLWRFEEGSGSTIADTSGNGNNGTLSGPSWIQGRIGNYALNFDDLGDSASIPNDDVLNFGTSSFTFSYWRKSTGATGGYTDEFCKGGDNRYQIWTDPTTNEIYFDIDDNVTKTSCVAPLGLFETGEWVLLTAVRDTTAGETRLYCNGIEVASATDVTGDIDDASSPLYLGGPIYSLWYAGKIDDLRLYNRALTEDEIGVLAETPIPGDIHSDRKIDFLDFAELAADWHELLLWPAE